jgi:crotonobetainyl-CoA:carnitine CoA-transferase CaiB-like acyl-CoA transferase
VREFLDHPQLAARGRWREFPSPVGPLRGLVPPVDLEGVGARMDGVPALGQHTDAILEEIGVDRATIGAWHREGTV